MGWKGTLRTINAAGKRAARESDRREKAANRAYAKIDRNHDQAINKVTAFERRLKTDPIKALGLTYDKSSGFDSIPFELSTELFNGSISLTTQGETSASDFSPKQESSELFTLSPLKVLLTRWATIIAIEIENHSEEYRIRTPWHKKSDPTDSRIYMLDTDNGRYYYPLSSQASGETLPGHPRILLFAFDVFQKPTSRFQLHISDVKLTNERGRKYTFTFDYSAEGLSGLIEEEIDSSSLVSEVESLLESESNKLAAQVKTNSSGCAVALLLGGVTMGVFSALGELLTG